MRRRRAKRLSLVRAKAARACADIRVGVQRPLRDVAFARECDLLDRAGDGLELLDGELAEIEE